MPSLFSFYLAPEGTAERISLLEPKSDSEHLGFAAVIAFIEEIMILTSHLFVIPHSAAGFRLNTWASGCVMKNDPYRMTMTRAQAAHTVPQIDPVYPSRTLHWPMMHGKQDGVSLPKRNNFSP
jgi:hypothetical protein